MTDSIIQRLSAKAADLRLAYDQENSLAAQDEAAELHGIVEELLAEREAGNRNHFVMDDGYDERNLLVNVTDEGVIMDAFLNGDHVGTSAMMADELFESIATTEETN